MQSMPWVVARAIERYHEIGHTPEIADIYFGSGETAVIIRASNGDMYRVAVEKTFSANDPNNPLGLHECINSQKICNCLPSGMASCAANI